LSSLPDDFEIEQADIVRIIETKEGRTEVPARNEFAWNKFNSDLACRVVKQFLKKYLPEELKVVGPNAYIDGHPTELDLLLVTESAIPEAFTNAYREGEVRCAIEVENQAQLTLGLPEQLFSQFTTLQNQYPHVNCTYLSIREPWNPERAGSVSPMTDLRKTLEPKFRVFCLSESRTQKIVPRQWREFVNHIAA